MKKLFTLAAAILASFSLWAQSDADIAIDAMTEEDATTYFKSYDDGATNVLYKGTYQQTGSNYNIKADQSNNSAYVGINSTKELEKVAFLVTGNGNNKNINAGLIGYKNVAETPDFTKVDYASYVNPSVSIPSANFSDAQWVEFDLSDLELKAVYFCKQWKNVSVAGASNANYPSSSAQSLFIYGIRVWYAGETATYTVTYKANNESDQADVVAADVKKVADNPFIAADGFKFTGWNTAADGSGDDYEAGAKLEANLTLYAQWAAVCYEATYDLKAGIGSAEVTAAAASIEGGALIISDSKGRITITPAEGFTFKKGDIIEFAGTVGNSGKPFGIKVGSDTYEAAEVIPNDPETPTAGGSASYSGVLKADAATIEIARDGGTTTTITSFVIKQETLCKTIVSTVETLTAVTVNDVAISATDLASLVSNKYLFLEDKYVTAPVVKFTKHTVITYDDTSTKEKDEVIEVTSQPATTTWGASATINGSSYYVYTSKAASRTVTYMYGEQVLGTETVAANGNPAEYAQYETMPLATFGGWYKDADLTQAVANIAAEVISADATYYAKFTKAYISKSVNIEQLVLDYGTKYDIKSALTAAGWAYENLNDLDTLNDIEKKDNRNYAFLGLKMKTTGAYIQGNLKTDGILLVKFGNVGCDIKVTVKGANTDQEATFTKDQLAAQDYEFPLYGYTEDVLVTFTTAGSSTVVLKQLMLDEIAEVTLPAPSAYLVTCAEAENGKVEANWANKKYRTPIGETVTLTATPAEGYEIAGITVDGEPLEAVEGVYSFIMPAKDVTVAATFSAATALDNTEASVKAVKFFQNGQLFIEKNGKVYTITGSEIR